MCGIAGIVSARPSLDLASDVARMCDAQAHRGPDGAGFLLASADRACVSGRVEPGDTVDGRAPVVAFGHRRLAIIDRAGGFQPMGDASGRVWITYNGEVYNFRELANDLLARGHRFHTRSDTEVVLAAYLEWGAPFVERLHGMFALAIWDGRDRSLLLARDPLGIKPLHWAESDGRLVFASELKGVLAAGGADRGIDLTALDRYLELDYVPAPFTIFGGVRKLEAATRLIARWEAGRIAVEAPRRFWRLLPRPDPVPSAADWVEGLRERVERSVRAHLVADVPVGAFLSGGIDSSVVVASMARAHAGPVRTFSIGFREDAFSELPYARQVAERCGTRHSEFVVTTDLLDVLPRLVAHHDEPFADPSIVPTHYVCRETRQHVVVALSGDGGDELFGGYGRYAQALRMQRVLGSLPAGVRSLLGRCPPIAAPLLGQAHASVRELAGLDPWERYRFLMTRFPSAVRRGLLRPEVRAAMQAEPAGGALRFAFDSAQPTDYLTAIQYTDLATYLPEDVLTKVDRASMLHSLEVRVPLLDRALVEYAFSIPSRFQRRHGESKWVLKRAFRDALDPSILVRPKVGFGIPLDDWLRGALRAMAEDLLLGTPDPYLDSAAVARLWDEHRRGSANWGHRLWSLLVLKCWLGQAGVGG